jgi:hypothetical protein
MKGSDGKYKVRVKQGKDVVLSFDMPGTTEPSDADVVSELKKRA